MKNLNYLISFLCIFFLFSSCANDSEEDLIDDTEMPQLVTYNANIKSIIDTNCVSCHSSPPVNGAPNSLADYNSVKNNVGSIIDRISRQEGQSGFMPLGGAKLPQNLIDLIEQWQTDGLLEN